MLLKAPQILTGVLGQCGQEGALSLGGEAMVPLGKGYKLHAMAAAIPARCAGMKHICWCLLLARPPPGTGGPEASPEPDVPEQQRPLQVPSDKQFLPLPASDSSLKSSRVLCLPSAFLQNGVLLTERKKLSVQP